MSNIFIILILLSCTQFSVGGDVFQVDLLVYRADSYNNTVHKGMIELQDECGKLRVGGSQCENQLKALTKMVEKTRQQIVNHIERERAQRKKRSISLLDTVETYLPVAKSITSTAIELLKIVQPLKTPAAPLIQKEREEAFGKNLQTFNEKIFTPFAENVKTLQDRSINFESIEKKLNEVICRKVAGTDKKSGKVHRCVDVIDHLSLIWDDKGDAFIRAIILAAKDMDAILGTTPTIINGFLAAFAAISLAYAAILQRKYSQLVARRRRARGVCVLN
jgi:hypothetical protein